jgi:hypothetical protein
LDVHIASVAGCALWVDGSGACHDEVRTFGTMTRDLLVVSVRLVERGVTHGAMESTVVFWKRIFNILSVVSGRTAGAFDTPLRA